MSETKKVSPAVMQALSSQSIAESLEVVAYVALQFLDWEASRRGTKHTRPAPDVVRKKYRKVY